MDKKKENLKNLNFGELFKQYEESLTHKYDYSNRILYNKYKTLFNKYKSHKKGGNIRNYSTNVLSNGEKYKYNKFLLELGHISSDGVIYWRNRGFYTSHSDSLSLLESKGLKSGKTTKPNSKSSKGIYIKRGNFLSSGNFLYLSSASGKLLSRFSTSLAYVGENNRPRKVMLSSKNAQDNNFILFNEVRKIMKNNPINHDTQLKIEKFLYNYSLNTDKSINIYDAIGRMNKSFKNTLIESEEELLILIKNFKKRDLDLHLNESNLKKKDTAYFYLSVILKEIPIDFIVSLLLGQVLIIINNPSEESNNCVNIFGNVGKQIINFYFYKLFCKQLYVSLLLKGNNGRESNTQMHVSLPDAYDIDSAKSIPYRMSDWKKDNSHIINIYNNDLIHNIGGLVIDWLREIDLLEIKLAQSNEDSRKNFNMFKVTDRIEKLLVKSQGQFGVNPELGRGVPLTLPKKIPMIVRPNEYLRVKNKEGEIEEEYGGFLLNKELTHDELIIQNWKLKTKSKIEDINQIYNAVNNISSVGYKINRDVLNFIRLYDSKFHLTLTMNDTVKNILLKADALENFEDLDSKPSYKNKYTKSSSKLKNKLYKWERLELESYKSKKYVEDNILALADLFEHVPEFFIPVRLDYRGRIYCITEYLNYQGSELAKGLLLFSKGEKILKTDLNAINYLKIFGANCFGNKLEKKSFIERVKWIDDNTENIINFYNG